MSFLHVPHTILNPLHIGSHVNLTPSFHHGYYHSHFTDGETELEGVQLTCPRTQVGKQIGKPTSPWT